jgi:hypothetical protein
VKGERRRALKDGSDAALPGNQAEGGYKALGHPSAFFETNPAASGLAPNPATIPAFSEWRVTHPESCNENAVFGELRSR